MRALGGTIDIRREPGRGCRVAVTLPLRAIPHAQPAPLRCPEGNAVLRGELCARPGRLVERGRTQTLQDLDD